MPNKEELREQAERKLAKRFWLSLAMSKALGRGDQNLANTLEEDDFDRQTLIDKTPYYNFARLVLRLPELASYFREGYVKLDEDQSLPSNPYGARTNQEVYQRAIEEFMKAGFVKVIREGG